MNCIESMAEAKAKANKQAVKRHAPRKQEYLARASSGEKTGLIILLGGKHAKLISHNNNEKKEEIT